MTGRILDHNDVAASLHRQIKMEDLPAPPAIARP
jgi:hypothetical protein